MRLLAVFTALIVFVVACQKQQSSNTQKIGERFFKISSERKDLNKILSFYSDDFEYENVIFESKTNDPIYLYKTIYAWDDPSYIFQSNQSLELESLFSNDSTIIAKGQFLPYTYNGNLVPEMRFIIYLELDKSGKIKKQIDWFNYPMSDIVEAWQIKKSINFE